MERTTNDVEQLENTDIWKYAASGGAGGREVPNTDIITRDVERIVKLSIFHGHGRLYAIKVHLVRLDGVDTSYQLGEDDERFELTEINFRPYEYIKDVQGCLSKFEGVDCLIVSSIKIVTNQDSYGPYGGEEHPDVTQYEFNADGGKIIGFHGRAGGPFIYAIGVYVKRNHAAITTEMGNLILNHNFSDGIKPWKGYHCHAYVATEFSGFIEGIRGRCGDNYGVATWRKERWSGLEQSLHGRIEIGVKYKLVAHVTLSDKWAETPIDGPVKVKATIRWKNRDSKRFYLKIVEREVHKQIWEQIEGSFTLPKSVRDSVSLYVYFEGPRPGLHVLVDCAQIFPDVSTPQRVRENALHQSASTSDARDGNEDGSSTVQLQGNAYGGIGYGGSVTVHIHNK